MNKLFDVIAATAAQEISADEDDFMVYDYSAGNIDDAYSLGTDHGEVYFARQLMRLIESEQ